MTDVLEVRAVIKHRKLCKRRGFAQRRNRCFVVPASFTFWGRETEAEPGTVLPTAGFVVSEYYTRKSQLRLAAALGGV